MLGNRVHFSDACFSASLLRCWSAMRIDANCFFFFCGFASLISALSAFFLCFSVSLLFSFLFFSACESNSKGSMLIVLARQKMRWHFVARHDEFDTGLSKSNGHFVAKE